MAKSGKKLIPKVKKDIHIGTHSRVGKEGVEIVQGYEREMDVRVRGDSPKEGHSKGADDNKRRSMVDDMQDKFTRNNNREYTSRDFDNDYDRVEHWGSLTDKEMDVMNDYVSEVGFNERLRSKHKDKDIAEDIQVLDEVINKSKPLKEDTLVTRGSRRDFNKTIGRELKVGEIFTDSGFMSTTVDPDQATNFMWSQDPGDGLLRFGTIYQINLPKGMKAAPVNPAESELLLPRDMSFEVLSTEMIDTSQHPEQVPRALQQHVQSDFMPFESYNIRSIHLRAIPAEGQQGSVETVTKLKPVRKTILRKKKK